MNNDLKPEHRFFIFMWGFLVGSIVGGIFFGVGIIGQGGWNLAMDIGKRQAIPHVTQTDMLTCVRFLREVDMNETQLGACANIIERGLSHLQ